MLLLLVLLGYTGGACFRNPTVLGYVWSIFEGMESFLADTLQNTETVCGFSFSLYALLLLKQSLALPVNAGEAGTLRFVSRLFVSEIRSSAPLLVLLPLLAWRMLWTLLSKRSICWASPRK